MSNAATNSRNATVDIFSGPPVKQMRINHLSQPAGTSSSAGVTSQITRSSIPAYRSRARRSARLAERNRVPDSHRNGVALHVPPPMTQQTLQEDDVIDLITPPPSSSNPHFNPLFPHAMPTTLEHTPQRSGLGDPNMFPSMSSSQQTTSVPSLVTDTDSSSTFAPFMYPNLIRRPPTLSSVQDTTQGSGQNSSDHTHNDAARPRASSQEQQRESVIRNTHRSSRHRNHHRILNPTRTTAEELLGRVGVEEQSFPGLPRLLTPSEQTVPSLPGHPHWLHGTAVVPSVANSHFDVDGFMAASHSGQTGPGQTSHHLSDHTTPPMLQHDVHIPPSPTISSGPIASPFISPPPPAGHNHDPFLTALFSSSDLHVEPWSPPVGVLPSTNASSGPSTPVRRMEVPLPRYSHPQPSLGDQHTHGSLSTSSQGSPVQEPRRHHPPQLNLVNHAPFSRPHPSPPSVSAQVRPHPLRFPRPVMTRSRTAGVFGPPDSSGSSSQTMHSSTAGRSNQAVGRSESGRSEPELIVVDDSDSDDDVIIESWIPGPPRSSPHWHRSVHIPSTRRQVDLDEAYARQLQAHFDEEASLANRGPSWPQHRQEFEPNFGVPVIPAGPSIPRPGTSRDDHPSGSGLIRDNFDALASRVHNWTRQDASRFLHVASNYRSRVRTGGVRSRRQLMESVERMPPSIFIRAIIGEHAAVRLSYEDLLELADNLGPARPQGLTKATLDRLPVTHFEKSADKEDQRCVVCMSSYEEKEKVRSLPCTHEFHQECIDQWFKDHRTCPICRVEIKCE